MLYDVWMLHSGQPERVLSDTISKKLKTRPKRVISPRDDPAAQRPDSQFAQFGRGDDEIKTGNKRTYNILSPQGVRIRLYTFLL